jgi:hypothetical protein
MLFIYEKVIITKTSTTTNQYIHLGEEGSPSRRLKTQCSESRKGAAKPTPLLTPGSTTRVTTWNIKTIYEAGRNTKVATEMKNYN